MSEASGIGGDRRDPGGGARKAGGDLFVDGAARARYFRVLRTILQGGLLVAYLVPISILTGYFYHTFNTALRESATLHMTAVAESQRSAIALQVQKQVVSVFNLFHSEEFNLAPRQHEMDLHLAALVGADADFVDIGFIDPSGIQVGYAGPYPYLSNKDYSHEQWYGDLIGSARSYVVTDLYLGLRGIPHFTIAVKQVIDDQHYVIRTSVNPEALHGLLTTTRYGKRIDGFLINRKGIYQAVDTGFGDLLKPAVFVPPAAPDTGVVETVIDGRRMLMAYTWLKEVPWCLIVMQPRDVAFKAMEGIRNSMIAGSAALVLVLMVIIWALVKRVVRWTESMEHDRTELTTQLYHAQKVVAVGQLASGVAHEINNPLAIISSESGLIRDMLDERMGMECTPQAIIRELDEIDDAVRRAENITRMILRFVHEAEPKLTPCNVQNVLDEVVGGVKERQFNVFNITLVRDYDPDTPDLMLDPNLMRQVFLNLVNNANDAVTDGCTITLRIRHDEDWIRIVVEDDGTGMTPEQVQKACLPFYTTKDVGKGTGLGLSISQNIVEGFGGHIEIESAPGVGSAFTVALPRRQDVAQKAAERA